MLTRFEEYLKSAAILFMAGRQTTVAEVFSQPLALHIEEAFVLLQSHGALEDTLQRYRCLLKRQGITAVVPRVAAIEIPRRTRFRAWVDMVFYAGTQRQHDSSSAIFYGHVTETMFRIEMLHFIEFAHPQMKKMIPARNRSG